VTKTVFAGAPEAMSTIALPGLSRIVRITEVQDRGAQLRLTGVVDDLGYYSTIQRPLPRHPE